MKSLTKFFLVLISLLSLTSSAKQNFNLTSQKYFSGNSDSISISQKLIETDFYTIPQKISSTIFFTHQNKNENNLFRIKNNFVLTNFSNIFILTLLFSICSIIIFCKILLHFKYKHLLIFQQTVR